VLDKGGSRRRRWRSSSRAGQPGAARTGPANADEGAAYIFSVIRHVSVPFGLGDPDRPNVASTIFRTVQDLTGGRYFFESTYAPNVVGVDITELDFTAGGPELELRVEEQIFSLSGEVTSQLQPAEPFGFGMNTP
jgi:choloylglycine hydrolase